MKKATKNTAMPAICTGRYNFNRQKGSVNTKPSKTQQGETLTIKDIMRRALETGQFPVPERPENYLDVPYVEDITSYYRMGLDLTDLQSLAQHTRDLQSRVDQNIAAAKKAQEERDAQAASAASEPSESTPEEPN